MAKKEYKTPFSDAVGAGQVPEKGSGSGSYDDYSTPAGVPGRDGGLLKELTFDTNSKLGGGPHTSGPYKTPFKDRVG